MALDLTEIQADVKERAITIGDTLEIFPIFGKKRTITLNRTRYQVACSDSTALKIDTCDIALPCTEGNEFAYKLNFSQDIFSLESDDGKPVKIDGRYARELLLFDGDEFVINYNKLVFRKNRQKSAGEIGIPEKVICSEINILLEGETGVGKSRLAKMIHERSGRRGEFVQINISALPISLIESELFGHKKGAFTGAVSEKIGALKEADYGTLFIDEVDSLPLDIQVKLLLFLDSKQIRPVGSNRSQECRARLIFATGSQLLERVKEGRMRNDFFYRINSGVKYEIPPLRKNTKLIDRLCDDFELEHNVIIPAPLRKYYSSKQWGGNVRQFLGHLHKKKVTATSRFLKINDDDLAIDEQSLVNEISNIAPFHSFKRAYFEKAFFQCGNNYKLAAKKLRVSEVTLRSNLNHLR